MNKSKKKSMIPFKITGDWNAQAASLKKRFEKLTDNDLRFETGKENELISRLETRLNKKREVVLHLLRKIAVISN